LSLVGSLSVKVARKIYLFTRYQAVFNGSNLSGDDLPVERSYSRQLLSAGVEARF
jgi:hypothetical protein